MAPHSSTLAWKIPWTEEPGGLQSPGSQSQTRLRDFTIIILTNKPILKWNYYFFYFGERI